MASSSSGNHDNARQTLVDRLLDAVKQCQIRFGGKTELATDNDSRVSCLCAQWETVLQFGIKSSRKLNPLRHVAGQVLLRPEGESALWQFLKEHLSPTEIRRFNSLQNVTTDSGRACAWLRSALNEQSLEKYLHSFLGNRHLLKSYFEQEALLMDEERSSMLPMMAAGLSSILFAINIDNPELNASKQSSSNQLAPASSMTGSSWHAPSPTYSGIQGKEKKKRKKKKANIAIPSIENADFVEKYDPEEASRLDNTEEGREDNIPKTSSAVTSSSASGVSSAQLRTGNVVYSNTSLDLTNEDRGEHGSSRDGPKTRYNLSRNVTNKGQGEHGGSRTETNYSNTSLSMTPKVDRGQYDGLRNVTNTFKDKSLGVVNQSKKGDIVSQIPSNTAGNLSEQMNAQTKCLNLRLPDVGQSGASQKEACNDVTRDVTHDVTHDVIDDEILVDLNSGVCLTPVACPDEARIWALQESDDSESPGNEGVADGSSPVAMRPLASSRDSPVSSGFTTDDDVSEDANLAIDATEAALSAAQDVHRKMADLTRHSLVRTMGDGRTSPPKEPGNDQEMTSAELKQAIVSMMLRKDEVEECNRSLRQLLDKEMQESAALRLQIEDLNKDRASSIEAYQGTVRALSSENDLLKHQLKKYVAAVQSLRRNEPLDIAVPGIRQDDDLPVLPEINKDNDSESKDVEISFERKLIQVADMHGELIELNERLQKMLNIREHQVRRLRGELVNLRGPLPDDASQDDSISLDDIGPRLVPVNTRPLINIWIPSAFAQGKSSSVHHTYQVYVRIKDDEWNVYRRYSHFHDMHKKISKQYPGVGHFKFPQKKVIGNRDAKFVEIRRRHLQSYLRKLINYSLRIIPELSENPSKSTLLKFFPFFCNSVKEEPVTTPAVNAQTRYTGL